MPLCDVAIVSWKSTENGHLAEVLPKALKPGGTVLVLQNGLDPERKAAAAVPDSPVLSGLCFLASRKEGPGWVRHIDYGAITLARLFHPGGAGSHRGDASRGGGVAGRGG